MPETIEASIDEAEKAPAMRSLTRRSLYARVWSRPMTAVADDLGISRNGLAKICDRLLVPYPGRGYWARSKQPLAPKAPLPAAPAGAEDLVVISAGRAASRRRRTRLPREARAQQLIEAAGRIIAKQGLAAATMKRVAREVGVSEAQAHNYFNRRTDLLVALARQELKAMDATRLSEADRAHDGLTRITLSTITYLRQVQQRGALIQTLLSSPEVRTGLRRERQERSTTQLKIVTDRLNNRYGVSREVANAATVVLTAICLRAGRLLAKKKISLEVAERLSLAIVTAGNRSITRDARAASAA